MPKRSATPRVQKLKPVEVVFDGRVRASVLAGEWTCDDPAYRKALRQFTKTFFRTVETRPMDIDLELAKYVVGFLGGRIIDAKHRPDFTKPRDPMGPVI